MGPVSPASPALAADSLSLSHLRKQCKNSSIPALKIFLQIELNYTKKGLSDLDNHDGVDTNLKPDILECEAKWALESSTMNKASGGDGIIAELFQILRRCC